MGLLDGNLTDQQLSGLLMLAAASPKRTRTGIGEGLLGAYQGVQQRRLMEEDRKQKQAMQAMQMGLLGAQIDETKAQGEQRASAARKAQQEAEENAALQRALMGATPQQALAAGGGPTPANAAQIGTTNWDALARQFPRQIDLIKKLSEARNFGRDEVAGTLDGTMPGTNMPATLMRDKFGGIVGSPVAKAVEMRMQDTGGALQAVNPFALPASLQKTNTPDALLSANVSMRGQNLTDARSREKNANDLAAAGKVDWKQDVNGNWVGLPKEVSGQGPVTPVTTTIPGKREQQSQNALEIIKMAESKIDKATNSYLGAGVDLAGRTFGLSTKGADAAAELKALEGALMMAQPRMEGPQSNYDVNLYRQMAASIGDPTVPASQKKAALKTIRGLHEKYAGGGGSQQEPQGAAAGQVRTYNPQTGRIE